ncbi:MAG: DUF3540 domain-containing protein [Polyangiaceae bacterium]
MSKVAVLKSVEPRPREADYLGPATVVATAPSSLEVRLPSGEVATAELALAFPYRASEGDVVLVIGRGQAHYVIGVMRGAGETSLHFQGDVSLRAVGGKLRLGGDEGVQVTGRELEVLVDAFKVVADSMVQRASSVYQRITGLLSTRAAESQTIVDGTASTKAKTGVILTEEKMTINGKQIYLG